MKKIVPDPPLSPTCTRHFGECPADHPPLFSVNAGIDAHSTLVHASMFLRCAYYSAQEATGQDAGRANFVWLAMHGVEAAKALIDALIDGMEKAEWQQAAD